MGPTIVSIGAEFPVERVKFLPAWTVADAEGESVAVAHPHSGLLSGDCFALGRRGDCHMEQTESTSAPSTTVPRPLEPS